MTAQPDRAHRRALPLRKLVGHAVGEFCELTGQPADRVSGVRRTDDGWSLLVDVVDVERVPATTSVLSTYRVDADADGAVIGYERIRRFTRASTDGR
ncbi:MAG: gas vesicle protein GvpO [Jatrophihabitans sp.]|uniref:gas vesicle protein GvpO n=1 Tax=Jatrophihabitans sp. TaxID=1932789 RepID=UPI003F7FB874